MSDYVKTTNFAAKDALLTGDSNKLIKGTEIGAEYDAVASASATKSNKVSGGANNNLVSMDAAGDIKNSGITTDGSGAFTSDLTIDKNTPTLTIDSATSGNGLLEFKDGGTTRGLIFWDRGNDYIILQGYDTDGTTVRTQIFLTETGDVNVATGTFKIGGIEPKNINEILTNKTISAGAYTGTQTGFTGDVTGNITGNVTGDVTGNADTATAWNSSRTVTITGDAAGTGASSNGTNTISISLATNSVDTNEIAAGAIGTENAALAVGAIGTYAMLRSLVGVNLSAGGIRAGSLLEYTDGSDTVTGTSSPAGTWRVMGAVSTTNRSCIWLRIS